MARLIGEPVETHTDRGEIPDAFIRLPDAFIWLPDDFIWRKRLYRVVEVLSCRQEPVDWWNKKPPRFFVRVNARNTGYGTYELCRPGDGWFLHRVLD